MSSVKKICISAICIALCYVLPIAFHSLGVGQQFSPMHLPVLLCGLLLGPGFGAFCGLAGPVLASTGGMPPLLALLHMVPELCTYGFVAGLLMKKLRTGRLGLDLYLSLIPAMVAGRIVGGIARMLVVRLLSSGEVFTVSTWVLAYFVGTLPGIIAQLVLLPALVAMLEKARVIPRRYGARG